MSSQLLANWRRDGLVLVRGVLRNADLNPIREVIEREVDAFLQRLHREGAVRSLHPGKSFARRLAAALAGTDVDLRKWHEFLFCREMYDLVTRPGILNVLEELLGPEITFHGDYQLVCKLPGSELTAFPWHQDTHYYGVPSQHMLVITVWLPLVEVNEHNGCLWVIPGSHTWGLLDAARGKDLNVRTFENVEALGRAMPVPMQPGDALFLTNQTFHASRMNRSREVRWSMDLGYSATPDFATLEEPERSSYAFLYHTLEKSGRTLLTARSTDRAAQDTWEQWLDRRDRTAAARTVQDGHV